MAIVHPASIIAVSIFVLVYALILAGEHAPRRLDRPSAALLGAVLMVICGVLSRREAIAAIDLSTLGLLLGMMIVIHYAVASGLVDRAAAGILGRARSSLALLWVVSSAAALLSALFINDTVCLLMTPLVLQVARRGGRKPEPYLIALATGSNVGSLTTITGNPQNMLIGQSSGWSWGEFALRMVPIGLVCLAINGAVLAWAYRGDLADTAAVGACSPAPPLDRKLAIRTVLVFGALLIAFVCGANVALAALTAAVALLVLANHPAEETLAAVDWSLLLFFAGLFVVIAGVTHAEGGLLFGWLGRIVGSPRSLPALGAFGAVTVAGSNLFSNVPYVMLVRGWIVAHGDSRILWLALAASSTLAGNLTLVGSVANLIVVQRARGESSLSAVSFLKVGIPSTMITTAVAIAMIWAMGRLGWV